MGALIRDGVVFISSAENGTLLTCVEEMMDTSFFLSSVAVAGSTSTCACAWPHKLVVFNVPWNKNPCLTKATFNCPQV